MAVAATEEVTEGAAETEEATEGAAEEGEAVPVAVLVVAAVVT